MPAETTTTAPEPALYRLHVHTSCHDRQATIQFCLDGRFLGVGWGAGPEPVDWDGYQIVAEDWYGRVDPSVRAVHDMDDGTLIWTRDPRGAYYLGRVTGGWRYLTGEPAERYDMRNVRPVEIVGCGVEAIVPGKVANSFIARRALQRINDEAARRYSASLFAELTGSPVPWHPTLSEVLTSCLTARDLEDLVATYLQRRHGYLVLPGSRRPDTPAYEYVLRHPDGHLAVAQVKSGWSTVPCDARSLPGELVDRVYVFSPTGSYGPTPAPNVQKLTTAELVAFMRSEPECLPPTVEHWVRLAV
jgi:hypothetical protein